MFCKMRLLIIIIVVSALVCCSTLSAQKNAKKVAISGIVVDGNRNAVPNVFITIDGKVMNSITDQQGYYRIKVSPSAEKIGFSTVWSEGVEELIQGEFPTIIVEGKSIRIPGAVSLKLSTEPLFVVDGIQVTGIDNIMPASVKSIQVLKGSSASIYGMKGANGVILINLLGSKNNNIVK